MVVVIYITKAINTLLLHRSPELFVQKDSIPSLILFPVFKKNLNLLSIHLNVKWKKSV